MRNLIWALGIGLASVAYGGEASKAAPAGASGADILKKAAEAAKQVKVVRYTFSRQGIGADEERSPKISGTVTFAGWAYNAVEKFRVQMKVLRPPATEPVEVIAGSDGQVVYLVDHAKKKVFADLDPAVLGAQAAPVRVTMIDDFLNPNAFADELKSEKIDLAGPTQVNGEDCHEVHCKAKADSESETVWFISTKDHLPRRMDMIFPSRDGKQGGRRIILSDLAVNPKLDGDPFKLVVPEGYTKTDEFAP